MIMMKDRFDNVLTISSPAARDHYVAAVDRLLAGEARLPEAFEAAVAADPGFALGFAGLARARQFSGDMAGAKAAMAEARALATDLTAREASHVHAMGMLIDAGPEAYQAIRAHVDAHPRDALIAQTCSSVFGLIGFSGRPGREAEILAYTAALLPHYGEEWWCLSQHAFALCENGDQERAADYIDRSPALNPRNANGAHVRSHVYYETGATDLGIRYLADWLGEYDRGGYLHGHLSWHCALWTLEQGDVAAMWRRLDADIRPGVSQGLPINVLTDMASLLARAEMAGLSVPPDLWAEVSRYAAEFFPKTGIGFVDIHAALAHAMAGEDEPLARIMEHPNPKTGDLVTPIAGAWRAMARGDWAEAAEGLTRGMADHARLGGSRAQRDLLEFALLTCLLRQGRDAEAKRLLALRRPALLHTHALHGLDVH